MNKMMIIGNLTRDPELRTVQTSGGDVAVCNLSVAVNRRRRSGREQEVDFVRVTTWRAQAENCARYLAKGRKVCAIGEATARAYQKRDGSYASEIEIQAEDIEFLTPKGQEQDAPAPEAPAAPAYSPVENPDELPF